jgi:hypothetical protein
MKNKQETARDILADIISDGKEHTGKELRYKVRVAMRDAGYPDWHISWYYNGLSMLGGLTEKYGGGVIKAAPKFFDYYAVKKAEELESQQNSHKDGVYMTVKEFIKGHSGTKINMWTPEGIVNLTPEQAKALLEGHGTTGHPFDPEMAVSISSEDLLPEIVCEARFLDGAWELLTDHPEYVERPAWEPTETDPADVLEKLNMKLDRNYADFISR